VEGAFELRESLAVYAPSTALTRGPPSPLRGAGRHLNIQRRLIRKLGALLDKLEAQFGLVAHQPLDGLVGGLTVGLDHIDLKKRAALGSVVVSSSAIPALLYCAERLRSLFDRCAKFGHFLHKIDVTLAAS
jgi:hypothetical protein